MVSLERVIVTFILCHFSDALESKLENNNVFNIAKRNVEGQQMLYESLKLSNGIWVLCEIKVSPGSSDVVVSH